MKREIIKQAIKTLQMQQIDTGKLLDYKINDLPVFTIDFVCEFGSHYLEFMEVLFGVELYEWITWRVYEETLKKTGETEVGSDGVKYVLENIEDFLDFLNIIGYIDESS